MAAHLIDMSGSTWGKWTVVSRAPTASCGKVQWLCRCECGVESVVQGSALRNGKSQSCGCGAPDKYRAAFTTHGRTEAREYYSWKSMLQRCCNPNATGYSRYGGRGITVCDRWRRSFSDFLADMGDRPAGTSLDRIDVDGNYEPGNCRWATAMEQRHNRRVSP